MFNKLLIKIIKKFDYVKKLGNKCGTAQGGRNKTS